MEKKQYKLFIGSSTESKMIAEKIKKELDLQISKDTTIELSVNVWDVAIREAVTSPNSTFMSKFTRILNDYDFGLFVLSKDDLIISRDKDFEGTRDNVWLEAGMFIGRKGLKNVFLFLNLEDFDRRKFPSDLSGIIYDGVSWDSRILNLYLENNHYLSKRSCVKTEIEKTIKSNLKKYCEQVLNQAKVRIAKNIQSQNAKIILNGTQCFNKGINLVKKARKRLYSTISFNGSLEFGSEDERNEKEAEMKSALLTQMKNQNVNTFSFKRYFNCSCQNIGFQYDEFKKICEDKKLKCIDTDEGKKILNKISFDYLEFIISDNSILMVFPNYMGSDAQKHNRVEFGFLIEENEQLANLLTEWLFKKVAKKVEAEELTPRKLTSKRLVSKRSTQKSLKLKK